MPAELFTPERWQRIKDVFDEAARRPPEERAAMVAAAADDPAVEREVLALLQIHDQAGTFLETRDTEPIEAGRRLGRYRIIARLGGGGMGDVYRAHDDTLDRDVAVKVIRGWVGAQARSRFQREARAIAALSHPNVLAIHDVGEEDGVPYLVTELLEGETLRARLDRGRISIDDAIGWVGEIARGLAAAHARGIVHRDLKPENVFLVAGGRLKILDFGLARAPAANRRAGDPPDQPEELISAPGLVIGTPSYLAPEQARGNPVTTAADLFALGAILFELLTGERAFRGAGLDETIRAVLDHDPGPPSRRRPEVPARLDRIVARCLAKDPADRFESARDLGFALEEARRAEPAPPRRPRWLVPVIAGAVVGLLAGAIALGVGRQSAPPPGAATPARAIPLTFSGRDRHPAVSPDGRFLAFTSDRDGTPRIWVQQLDVGAETPLTDGPDSAPRFSPDGSQILFTRGVGGASALYRAGLLGGEVRKVVDRAADGDWSPDGRRVVFVRPREVDGRNRPVLVIADLATGEERELGSLGDRPQRGRGAEQRVRWSPDGAMIAVTGFLQHPGTPQQVQLFPADGASPRALATPNKIGLVSAVAWESADTIVYSQSLSVSGNSTGSAAQIVRQRVRDGAITTLLWSTESSFVVDRWPGRGIVFDARSSRTNLREVAIADGAARLLSQGTATDRQPCLSPDGARIVFTSNRGGTDLDLWVTELADGTSRRLTDDPGEDWDPAFTPDGQHLLWSSDRSGNFEIWIADADGSNPRQLTRDGVDAENPTMTADGRWVVYASGAEGRAGIWRIGADGTEAQRLVADVVLPEVSPDGRYVLFQANRTPGVAIVGVARVADGEILPFEIRIEVRRAGLPLLGRARWLPGGDAIAFVGQDEAGATGVFQQAFSADGADTTATRVKLAGFHPELITESFDVDGARVIVAESDQRSDVMAATGLADE